MTLEVIVFQFVCQQLSLSLHVSKWENVNSRLTLDMWTTSSPNVQSQKPMKRIVFAPVSWPPFWTCSANPLKGITGTVGELWMGKVGHCLIPAAAAKGVLSPFVYIICTQTIPMPEQDINIRGTTIQICSTLMILFIGWNQTRYVRKLQ